MSAFDSEIITVSDNTTVHQLTVPTGANYCEIDVQADDNVSDVNKVIRYYKDGTTPTTTNGRLAGHQFTLPLEGGSMKTFRAIGIEASVTHKLVVEYSRISED